MKSSEYWRTRQEQLIESLLKSADSYVDEIGKGYAKAIKTMQGQIATWFMRFAENNQIDLITALKLLNSDELQELRWTIEEYIAHAKADGITDDWSRELENASAKLHISRLEALKLQTRAELEKLYAGRSDKVQELLGGIYQESILKNGYEHYQRTGIETTFATINNRQLEQIVKKPWTVDGLNFSDRIWRDKQKLIKTLNTELTNAAARGETPLKTADRIAQALNADKRNARRLVFTESAYFATQGQNDCYKELGVDEFEDVCTLDGLTCEVCGSYDGKHYYVEEMQAGVNAPPFHPNCRCTTVPYFDDEFTEGEKRAARDEDGNSVLVDDMSYKEWKEKYVDNSGESGIIKIRNADINSRNTSKGKPNAILQFDVDLNNRQKAVLDELSEYDSRIIVKKSDIKMSDLAALTAKTGDEFAMLTNGSRRMIIRGDSTSVNIGVDEAKELAQQGYRFSGHTHPGIDRLCLMSSEGDRLILSAFGQEQSVIYNSKCQHEVFLSDLE